MESLKTNEFEPDFYEDFNLDEVELEVEEDEKVDLSAFIPMNCSQKSRAIGEVGVISVVHSNNGMRVVLSKELMEELNNPKSVQFGLSDKRIAISEFLGDEYISYPMNESGAKKVIYRSGLVKQITDQFDLDFSERTSITFSDVKYVTNENDPIAIITINK